MNINSVEKASCYMGLRKAHPDKNRTLTTILCFHPGYPKDAAHLSTRQTVTINKAYPALIV